jgi:hypothetical protein
MLSQATELSANADRLPPQAQPGRDPGPHETVNGNRWWFLPLLSIVTLVSRLAYRSAPYYVDGPAHVTAISSGVVFIQPPGYYLFGETARWISILAHISPALSITALNVLFSVAGVLIFSRVAAHMFSERLAMLLSLAYAFSDTVWFVSDIHSTYAAMTFFGPALLYAVWIEENWWLAGLLWGAMTGFRPSDGVFLSPFVLFALWRKRPRDIVIFVLTSMSIIACWYVPTVKHFGGSLLSPLSASGSQVQRVANGLLTHASFTRKIGNLVHIVFGAFDAWSILAPFVVIGGLVAKDKWSRQSLVWMGPGILFFICCFFSDAVYLSYAIAPGFILAGAALSRLRPKTSIIIASMAVLISFSQMMIARPLAPTTTSRAVLNSYLLQYSGWAIDHRYWSRLRDDIHGLH